MDGAAWSVRVYYKPFIRWIWLGGLLMMAGGLCSVSDRRYRLASLKSPEPHAAADMRKA
jgi:cytochrome c-type biogenesis protein CcmF